MFGWYEWYYYRKKESTKFPYQQCLMSRVLGPIKNQGNEMAQDVLTISGTFVPWLSVAHLTGTKLRSPAKQSKCETIDNAIYKVFGDCMLYKDNAVPKKPEFFEEDSLCDNSNIKVIVQENDPIDTSSKAVLENPFTDVLTYSM